MAQETTTILHYVLLISAILIALGVLRLFIKKLLDSLVASGRLSPSVRSTTLTMINLFIALVAVVVSVYLIVGEYLYIVVATIACLIIISFAMFFGAIRSYLVGIALRTTMKSAPYIVYLPQHKVRVNAVSVRVDAQHVELNDVYGNTYYVRNEQFANAILAHSFVNIPIEITVEHECSNPNSCYLFVEKVVNNIETRVFTGMKKEKRVFINEISNNRSKLLIKLSPINYPVRPLDFTRISRELAESIYEAAKELEGHVVVKDVIVKSPSSGLEFIE